MPVLSLQWHDEYSIVIPYPVGAIGALICVEWGGAHDYGYGADCVHYFAFVEYSVDRAHYSSAFVARSEPVVGDRGLDLFVGHAAGRPAIRGYGVENVFHRQFYFV